MSLIPDRLRLTAGAKYEHSNYSGSNLQPSLRLLWAPAANRTGWMAISRAVRTPSIAELAIDSFVGMFPLLPNVMVPVALEGNPR